MKFISRTYLIIISVILVIVSTVLMVLWKPEIIINDRTLNSLDKKIQSDTFSLKWESITSDIHSESLLRKTLSLNFKDICIDIKEVNGCFPELSLNIDFILGKPMKIVSIGPVKISSERVNVFILPKNPNKKKTKFQITNWVSVNNIVLKQIDIAINSFSVTVKDKMYEGSLKLISGTEKSPWSLDVSVLPNEIVDYAKLTVLMKDFQITNSTPWEGNIDLKFKLKNKDISGTVNAILNQKEKYKKDFEYQLAANVNLPKRNIQAVISGSLTKDTFLAKVNSNLTTGIASIPKIKLNDCEFSIKKLFDKVSSNYNMECGFITDVILPIPPDFPDIELPKSTGAKISAHFDSKFPPSANDPIKGEAKLILDPILTPLFSGAGELSAKIEGKIAQFPKNLKADAQLDLKVKLPKFQVLVKKLEGSNWSVPAPVNQLKGMVEFGIKGQSNIESGQFPFYLTTRAKSKYQNFDVDSKGNLFVNLSKIFNPSNPKSEKPHKLDLDVQLSNIQLALPRLKLEAPPRLIPDSRITRDPIVKDDKTKKFPIEYDIKIHTGSNPVRVLSNLISVPIPIFLDSHIVKGQPIQGSISVGNFPVELFKRKGSLEKLSLTFNGKEAPVVDGEVSIDYVDYSIKIYILGTTEKPIVKVESDPPLSQDEVIAVLIYGRTLEELDADQQESVGNTKSALADQSLGLASLYLFASTPIESVGYSAETQQVTAKVKLAQGTSLNLGTGSTTNRVGIKRRLSKYFTITTDYTRDSSTTGTTGSDPATTNTVETLIEWSQRY